MADILSDKPDTEGFHQETNTGSSSSVPSASGGESAGSEFYEKMIKEPIAGEIIKGKVVCITKDVVIVDIGYKSEGHIPVKEFLDVNGNLSVKVGDEVEAMPESGEDDKGYIILSMEKARQAKAWDELEEAHKTGTAVEGKIVKKVKAGFNVDFHGVAAFLPGSQVDLKPVNDAEQLLNNVFMFKVLQYDRRKPNIVVSRRAYLEEKRERLKKETVETLEEGKIVEGIVKNITNYGVFVDLGGIDGLLHITDMSWGRVKHPSELFKTGDRITVKILRFDKAENKLSLGLKQLKPNPWDVVSEKYQAGARVKGRVIGITDYGAFVEIEEGVEGLIHLSELSWAKIKHPSQRLKNGDAVEVKILEIDAANQKLSLSLKQCELNPWDAMSLKYAKGTRVKGIVKNIADYGVFVSIEDGVDGLAHISDLSWKKIKHPSELFQKGQEVEAEVISVDRGRERLSLSVKALQKDPWEKIEEKYHAGMSLNGRITNITGFGAFVELEAGVEGLIHISELSRWKKRGLNITVGDMVETEVLNVDPEERKIGLGLKGPVKTEV